MHFTHALPRPARNERGEGWGEGKSNKTKLLSPTLSSSFVGREGEAPSVSDANFLNSMVVHPCPLSQEGESFALGFLVPMRPKNGIAQPENGGLRTVQAGGMAHLSDNIAFGCSCQTNSQTTQRKSTISRLRSPI
jgi:hypothetical protein